MEVSKDTKITVSISVIAGIITSVIGLWTFSAPIAQRALAGEIQDQLEPITDAFTVLLITNITNQRNAITAMRFKRDTSPLGTWTLREAQDLDAAEKTLVSMEQALVKINTKR